jgi:crotonobetainyl-CoA:carnitine CoA-transferase CaiB-like acyl-CoA transferase
VELASWTFVPSGGAVLADWGADVLKIEHPETGDPQRGLVSSGLVPGVEDVNYLVEQPNRGKRSVAIDVRHPEGRELLYRLIETADVFLTNLLPDSCKRLGVDVDSIRAHNPQIIYVRGHGQGVRGPDAGKGGFDSSAYWARSGIADSLAKVDGEFPPLQRPAFGDVIGGQTLAGGIAAALFRRERHGTTSVLDVSLLGLGLWNLSFDVVASRLIGERVPKFVREELPNPLTAPYRTADDRFVWLVFLQSDRHWPEFCAAVERPDLLDDPRFDNAISRFQNRAECNIELGKHFATQPLEHWQARLADIEGVWAVVQTALEVADDPQVVANGYMPELTDAKGTTFRLVANPVQFDEQPPVLSPAPEHGAHTDEVLLELGYDWDRIIELKQANAIL